MPMKLEGSCNCGAVSFSVGSHTPHPYMRCYCNACRKTNGGGGFAINIMGLTGTLNVTGRDHIGEHGIINDSGKASSARRSFCRDCGTMLWNFDPRWADLIYPFASAIDTALPVPPHACHIMQDYKASWVVPDIRDGDKVFARYPDQSIEDWHRSQNLWVA